MSWGLSFLCSASVQFDCPYHWVGWRLHDMKAGKARLKFSMSCLLDDQKHKRQKYVMGLPAKRSSIVLMCILASSLAHEVAWTLNEYCFMFLGRYANLFLTEYYVSNFLVVELLNCSWMFIKKKLLLNEIYD